MNYYARIDGEQRGPFTLEQLKEAGVRPRTWVWCKGMPDWQRAQDVAEICRFFRIDLSGASLVPSGNEPETPQASDEDAYGAVPVRFRRIVEKSGQLPGRPADSTPDLSEPPRNWTVWAIIATLLCFWPAGILAVFFSLRSSRAWKNGSNEAAHEYAARSRMWTLLSVFLGLIMYAVVLKAIL